MFKDIAFSLSVISDFISRLFPAYALAGGLDCERGQRRETRPSNAVFKGGGGGTPNIAAPPAPPPVNLPPPPAPPPPPPPPQLADSVDVAKAQLQAVQASSKDFGYQASLLGNNGNDPAQRPQNIGSLLGNGRNTAFIK